MLPNCPYCTPFESHFKELEVALTSHDPPIKVGHVDLEMNEMLHDTLHIEEHPTFILFKGPKEIARYTGEHTSAQVS